MTCPCLYPMKINFIDEDGSEVTKWFMPDDEIDTDFEPPKVNFRNHESIEDYNNPDIKLYQIDERISVVQTDEDGDKNIYWSISEDEISIDAFKIPELDLVTQEGVEYVSVIWKSIPKNANIKSYEVNGHLVYAGCALEDLKKKGSKMVCKEKELFKVLHPAEEWVSYHVRNFKA